MNNLHVLSTGVLVNDPLIEWAGSHISNSTLYKCFNMEWTIVTHSKERAEKAILQAKDVPIDIRIIVDELSRTDRDTSTVNAIKEIADGDWIWMLPEGSMVDNQSGSELMQLINKNDDPISVCGNLCLGYDHIIFKKSKNTKINNANDLISFANSIRSKGRPIEMSKLHTSRGEINDMDKLAVLYWNLKFWMHTYTPYYHETFTPLRKSTKRFLEIGIAFGGSLRTWRDYFPEADIFGVDIYPESVLKEYRINGIVGDSTDKNLSKELLKMSGRKFDIINDDGDHSPEIQFKTFQNMCNLLSDGGIYVIEDVYGFEHLKQLINKEFNDLSIETIDLRHKTGKGDSVIMYIRKLKNGG